MVIYGENMESTAKLVVGLYFRGYLKSGANTKLLGNNGLGEKPLMDTCRIFDL